MERTIEMPGGARGVVTLNEPVLRFPDNPVLTRHHVNAVWQDPQLQVTTVHNAGVARLATETVMLFRSHLRCGVSVIGAARSADGITDWQIAPRPVLVPARKSDPIGPQADRAEIVEMESGGVEDPRINPVDGGFAVTYSAYHGQVRNRVRTALATTEDFTTFVRYGPMVEHDMRNVVIFPVRIGGRYVGLFRPNDERVGDTGGTFTEIRMGYTDDFRNGPWEIDDRPAMRTGAGPSAFSDKIGPGAPPIRTRHGWLSVFHGVRTTMDGNPYVLGVALHDLDDPHMVRMSSIPILFPSAADCRVPAPDYIHVPNVVFSCAVHRRPDGSLLLYYGGNDTVMNVGFTHEDVLAELCHRYGQDPLTGDLRYDL